MRRSSLVATAGALALAGLPALPAVAVAAPASAHSATSPVTRLRAYDDAPGATVVWTDPTTGFDHSVLRYARGPKAPGRHDGTNVRLARSATSASLTGLRRDTVYSVTVWAVDARGDRSTPSHTRFTTDAAGRGHGTYTARYTDPAGRPLAGVETVADNYASGTVAHAVSGSDGRVSLSIRAGGVEVEAGGQQITGGSADATGYVGSSHFVTVDAGRTTSAGTLVLRPGGAMRIRAVDSTGSPVAGLVPSVRRVEPYVSAQPSTQDGDVFFLIAFDDGGDPTAGRTASDGTVVVRGVPAGVAYDACAGTYNGQPGNAEHVYRSTCVPSAAVARVGQTVDAGTLTLDAAGGATITGRLAGRDGRTFANSAVDVSGPADFFADTTTSSDGSFRLGGLAAGTYRVCSTYGSFTTAGPTGYRSACRTTTVTADGSTSVALSLRPGAAVTGTVTGPGGVPVPDAQVQIGGHGASASSTTDLHGQFVAQGLPTGSVRVCVRGDTVARSTALPYGVRDDCRHGGRRVTVTASLTRTGVDFRLSPGGTISGTVVDTAGRAVPHALVIAEATRGLAEVDGDSGRTGSFTLAGLSTRSYRICAIVPVPDNATGVRCGEPVAARVGRHVRRVVLTLPATSTIDVTTVDTQDRPVSGVDAVVVRRCTRACTPFPLLAPTRATPVASDVTRSGHVRLEQLLPGRYDVCAFAFFGATPAGAPATGYADTCSAGRFRVTVRLGHVTTSRLVLRPGGAVTGRVTDTAGDPLRGVRVHVAGSAAADADDGFEDGFSSDENIFDYPIGPATFATTARDGTFTIRGVRPGSRLVCFDPTSASGGSSPAGYLAQCSGGTAGNATRGTPVSVGAGRTTTADIALSSAAGISGRLTFPANTKGRYLEIAVFRNGIEVVEDELGRNGRYAVTGLAPATYTVCGDYISGAGENVGRCYRDAAWNPEQSTRPPSDATPVTATGGVVTSDIDITFPR